MSNRFMSYFGGGSGSEANRFVGQLLDLGGGNKLKVKKVIAEGGFGYVFVAQDVSTGKDYALKRQVVDKDNIKVIKKEIAFLKQLEGHPHIVQYVSSAGCPPSQTTHGNAEFLIQTELCTGGRMEDIILSHTLSPKQVLRVFSATCSAVAHMHSQRPPIIHRDLKVENLLLTSDGAVKLCDFGSATIHQVNPDPSWTSVQRGLAEDEIQHNTTPMYRAPEMIDLYSNKPVNERADIWALGCLLYKLCFKVHPFEDSAKLRILNANYKIPPNDTNYTVFHSIIRECLSLDPSSRPSVDAITAQLYGIADQLGEDMEKPSSDLVALTQNATQTGSSSGEGVESEDGGGLSAAFQSTSQHAQKFFGYMKDGAGSFFKNIKESSSKVIQSMTDAVATAKQSLDVSYITSRIIAMSYPHDDPFHQNNLSTVRAFLDEKHSSSYLVFNLSDHSYDPSKLDNHVYDFPWPHRRMPDLEKLVDVCRTMDAWLRADKDNIIVVHCSDGRSITSIMIASYLIFLRAVSSPALALKLFWTKRDPNSPPLMGSPSQMRYLQHLHQLVQSRPYKPHGQHLTINMLRLSTVPLFNAIRTGCKPLVEVYQDGERIYASATHDNMESIRSFHSEDGCVEIPMEARIRGNLLVVIHHIRAIPVAKKAGIGMTAVRMLQFQMHTGFLDTDTTCFQMERHDLDGSSVKKQEKFMPPFHVTMEVEWNRAPEDQTVYSAASWQNLPYPKANPVTCFSSRVEEEETAKMLLSSSKIPSDQAPIATSTSPPPTIVRPPSASDLEGVVSNPMLIDEESSSAGAGTLLNLETNAQADIPRRSSAHDFFSQLNWAEQTSGSAEYAPFQDQLGAGSDSSSDSGDDDDFNNIRHDPFSSALSSKENGVPGSGVPFVNFDDFENQSGNSGGSNDQSRQGQGKSRKIPTPQSTRQEEAKLIEFSIAEDNEEIVEPQATPTKNKEGQQSRDMFGVSFDPWGTPSTVQRQFHGKTALEVSDLLGLEDSDEHSTMSDVQSEVRAAGAETFSNHLDRKGMMSNSANGSRSPSSQFDLFGSLSQQTNDSSTTPLQPQQAPATTSSSLSNDPLFNLLMNTPSTNTTSSATVTTNATSASTGSSPDPFANLLGPTSQQSNGAPVSPRHHAHHSSMPPTLITNLAAAAQSSIASQRRVSQPPHFNNHLSPLHNMSQGGPRVGGAGSGLGYMSSHSQPNLSAYGSSGLQQQGQRQTQQAAFGGGRAGHPSYMGGGSATSSPRSMSPTPFGAHSSSTGNLQNVLQGGSSGGGGQATMAGRVNPTTTSASSATTSTDPFAQFNLGFMTGAKPTNASIPGRNPSQSAFKPQPSQATPYQPYYMRQPASSEANNSSGAGGRSQTQQGKPPQARSHSGSSIGAGGPTPVFGPRKPNYNPVIGPESKTGIGPKPKRSDFSDLLGGNFSAKPTGPRTLKDMRAESDINNALDPDKAKVAAWAERKERNIRALLSSLKEILWEGESKWYGVGMHQLVQPDQVKKHYRKACLSVHPDKCDAEHENLARAIFDELNDAYSRFEESGAQPLY